MKNINLKRFISIVCAVVLLAVAVFEPSWFGKNSKNVDEVNAADVAVPTGFTELKWTDFSGLAYQEYTAPNPDAGAKGTYSGNLHQTLLNGNIIMGSDVDIRFAGAGWTGLMIRTLTDGTLYVENSTFDTSYNGTYQPGDYGLTSFIGNEFNLKISTEISGNDYTFGIWVNDKILGDYFTLTEAAAGEKGTSIGFYHRGSSNNVKLLPVPINPPTDFRELKWVDFTGLAYQEYVAPNPDAGAKGTYSGSLHQTLLNGDIIMGYDTDLRFAGGGWTGLAIQTLTDGTLWVYNSTFDTSYSKVYQPSDYGLTSFIDNKFNLKISTEISGNDYTFGIWINDKILGDYFTLTEAGGEAGTSIGLYHRGSNYNVELVKIPATLPTDFTELKWVDFTGLAYQEYATANPDTGAKGTYSGDLNKTMLNGNIVMGSETDIRYAGSNGWAGLNIIALSDGTLRVENGTFDTSYGKTYQPGDYGLTSFVGVEFNLKITTEISGNNYKFSVWVNDKVLDDYFTLTEANADEKGTAVGFYHRGSNNNVTLVKMPVNLPTDFTELAWTDFTGLAYQEYATANPDTGAKGTYSGDLNKTILNGNIIMGSETDIRYAGSNGWAGLNIIALSDGTLRVENGTFDTSYGKTYQPGDYGLTSFVGVEFNLKITTEISGNKYKFSVWVNNQVLDDYFTLSEESNEKGTTVGFYHRGSNNNITLDEASLEAQLPADFTTLKWSDFTGLEYKEYVATNPDAGGKGTYAGSLHQTMLDDNIIFGGNTDIRYGGTGWSGIVLEVAADGSVLYVRGGTYDSSYNEEYAPGDYGLTSFANTEFNLKITTEISGDNYTFSVWVNNQVLGNYFTLTKNTDTAEGSCVGLYDRGSGNSITLKKAPINPPTDYTKLGWTDFAGLICKEYVATNPDAGGKGTYSGSLHQTLLNGNIIFGGNTDIRYGGTGWSGIVLEVAADGSVLYVRGGTYDGTYNKEYYPADYGLVSFKDTEFNLKISTKINGDNYTFGVWVNNQILGNYFTLTKNAETAEGSCVGLYDRGSGNSITLVGEKVPTDYTILTPLTSFGIAAGDYVTDNGAASVDAPTEAVSKFDKVILQFHKITYAGNVDLGWGGENVWVGFRLRSDATAGTLTLQSGYSGASGYNQLVPTPITMTDAVAGVDLVGGTYNLKISMEYTDETTIKMGIWFNDILYNNKYVTVDISKLTYESGDALGLHLGVVSQNGGGTITFGEEEITLPDFYWNLADGIYTLPSTATDAEGNSITQLDKTGDHYITYTFDGKILERNVFIWEIGDVKVDDDVNSKDLVRTKKLASGFGGDTDEAGKEAADFDKDNDVDKTDVYNMQRLLLGDVFEYGLTLSEKMLGEGKKDVMPIVGYYGPASSWSIQGADGNSYTSKDTVTDAIYQLISEVGINLITASNDAYTDANKAEIEEQLTLAKKYGLSMFVKDGRIHGSLEHSHEELQYYLDGYGDYEAFAGLFIVDEPRSSTYPNGYTSATFDDWAGIGKKVNQYGNLSGYVNLNPYYEGLSTTSTKTEGYQAYLTEYIEKFDPQYLSFDYYLFSQIESSWFGWVKEPKDVDDCDEYLQNLVMVRNAAKNNDIPFWSFVQAGSNWNDDIELMESTDNDTPSEGQFKWQANIALALGAKGITYFPLIQPHYFALTEGGTLDYKRNGLIAEDGSINSWFGYAQQVNKQIAAVDEVLMNATNKGVIPVGTHAKNNITSSLNNLGDTNLVISSYDKLSGVSTTGTTYGAVVGCFDYNGKTALYVVNYDVTTSRDITLNFSESVTADVTISGTATEKSGSSITLTLGAGEGALVVLK